jgi:hypothetical protein
MNAAGRKKAEVAPPLLKRRARRKRGARGEPAMSPSGPFQGPHLCPLSSLSTARIRFVRLGFRDSFGAWQRRSIGNDRKPSRPRPERIRRLSHQTGRRGSGGGAADEAAAMRTRRACPSECGRQASWSAHDVPRASARRMSKRDERDSGPGRTVRCGKGLRFRKRIGADGGFRFSVRQADPGLRPRMPPERNRRFGKGDAKAGEAIPGSFVRQAANRQGFGPVGEPAGEPDGARASDGPGRAMAKGTPGSRARVLRSRPARSSRPSRLDDPPRRDSGGRQRCRPPLLC